jgi:hypothetical protein
METENTETEDDSLVERWQPCVDPQPVKGVVWSDD